MTQIRGFGLELIHNCNAKCVFCRFKYGEQPVENLFTHQKWVKQRRIMDWELVKKIFEKHQPQLVIMTGQGEPFLYPHIPELLKLGREQGNFALAIFSNANMMTEKILDQLIPDPQFCSINFSLNAATDGTRLRVMNQPYQQAEDNIMMFLQKRRAYGREQGTGDHQSLRVGVSFITVRENTHERGPFVKHWSKILRDYNCNPEPGVFPAGNWGGAVPREALPQTMKNENPAGCGQWECTGPTVDVDGNIMLCCYSSAYSFGSILDDEACDRWNKRKELFNVGVGHPYYPETCHACSQRFVPEGWDSA